MSKIVCDVCGTSYPESATQCPICGCVRPSDPNTVALDTNEQDVKPNGTYTYVKGGRFSKANVKKRNQGLYVPNAEQDTSGADSDNDTKKGDKGFIVAVVLLLAAILAVIIYIAVRFIVPMMSDNKPADIPTGTVNQVQQTQTSSEPTTLEIPCQSVRVSQAMITLNKLGGTAFLSVTRIPADTTDVISFTSSNNEVVTVDSNGHLTAVGPGEAVITITCGSAKTSCRVVCDIESETTEPEETTEATEATTEATVPTVSEESFVLNRDDITMSSKGETWLLYNGDIPVEQIKWYSNDETVATIQNGVVTAVGGGYTTVYGEYGNVKRSCIIRCNFSDTDEPTDETTGTQTCTISHSDVTITINETFILGLFDQDGNPVNVTWTVADPSVCSVEGSRVTGLASGTTTVSATYGGVTYSCIVRVK